VLTSGDPLLVPVLEPATVAATVAPQYRRYTERFPMRTLMIAPLRVEGRVLGVLTSWRHEAGRPYGGEDLLALSSIADRAAVALENARLYAAEQRARSAAEEALRMRDEFLSVAAHELKTPITSLWGMAQLMLRQLDKRGAVEPDRLQRALRMIDTQSRTLARLVEQLLDVSRIEAGKLALDRQPTDLGQLVRAVVAMAQVRATEHRLRLRTPRAPVRAAVDPLRLEQVVTNLLDNAIKYSPEGGEIEVELAAPEAAGVRLSVRDRGLGIPPERRRHIFDRFYQAHATSHQSGMGLGLYISRQIVELHGGRIEAEFPPDGGTRLVVRLPAAAPTELQQSYRGKS
jgi:signal transduction histidine kinase